MFGRKFVTAAVLLAVTVTTPVRAESLRLSELLLDHYLNAPLYQMSNPLRLNQYQRDKTMVVGNGRQVVSLYRNDNKYGYITVAAGREPRVNLFEVEGKNKGVALVLKDIRICLVEGADRAPRWTGQQLQHSNREPGKFECSGQTRTSLFQPYSGMPRNLGYYYEDGDTVLFDEDRRRLERIAKQLRRQFRHTQVGPSAKIRG
jgi:hypothetical protein